MTLRPALIMLCACAILPLQAQPVPSDLVVTAYYSERPPFTIVEGQTGILINLTKAILAEAGIRARFIELPTPRIVERLLALGPTNALAVGWFKTDDPSQVFSLPLYQEQPIVALLNNRAIGIVGAAPSFESLLSSGLTLGIVSGLSLGPEVDQMIRAKGIVPLETMVGVPAMLRLVRQGRMDYTLLSGEEAQYLLRQDTDLVPGLTLVKLPTAPPGNRRYFLYSPGFSPFLAAHIDAAIEKLNSARTPAAPRPVPEAKPLSPPKP